MTLPGDFRGAASAAPLALSSLLSTSRNTAMPWLQLKAHIAPEQAETLEELLLAEGATAITTSRR